MAGSIFSSELDAVNNMVTALFRNSFSEAQNNLPFMDVATDLGKSSHKTRQFDWLGDAPEVTDVTHGTLRTSGLNRFNYSISHVIYKLALRIPLSDLETDSLGQIPARITGAARKMSGHPGRLGFDKLEANPTAYDGAALFANTRAYGSAANVDNLLAGSGTSAAQIAADLQTLRATMMRFENDQGEPMELSPNVLVIPPELEGTFRQVLQPLPVAQDNTTVVGVIPPQFGNRWQAAGYTVYTLARLSDSNNWFGLHTGEEVNPFIYSWVSQPQPQNSPSSNDKSAIDDDELVYVFRGHYNVGVTLPQYFACVVN